MKNKYRIFMAIACLALAALACQAATGTPGGSNQNDVAETSAPDVNVIPEPTQTVISQ